MGLHANPSATITSVIVDGTANVMTWPCRRRFSATGIMGCRSPSEPSAVNTMRAIDRLA